MTDKRVGEVGHIEWSPDYKSRGGDPLAFNMKAKITISKKDYAAAHPQPGESTGEKRESGE